MPTPQISVIIPAYNEEKYISVCLKSVANQDFPKDKYEIVVVDNNSTDRTRELVRKKFPQVRLVEEKKQGVVFARIKGIETAKGKIIAFIDADSFAPKNWLKNISRAFKDPNLTSVGGFIDYRPKNLSIKLSEVVMQKWQLLTKMIYTSNLSFRKDAYNESGGFSPKINFGEEIDISLKLKKTGRVIILKDNSVISSSRRLISPGILFDLLRYQINLLSILFFKKSVFYNFKPVRDKAFLNKYR